MNTLENLPKYVLYKILNYIPFYNLQNICLINRYFYKRISDIEFWKARLRFNGKPIDQVNGKNFKKIYQHTMTKHILLNNREPITAKFSAKKIECSARYIALTDWDNRLVVWKFDERQPFPCNKMAPILDNVRDMKLMKTYMTFLTYDGKFYIMGKNIARNGTFFKYPIFVCDNVTQIFPSLDYSIQIGCGCNHSPTIFSGSNLFIKRINGKCYGNSDQLQKYIPNTNFVPISQKLKQIIVISDTDAYREYAYIDSKNNLYIGIENSKLIASNIFYVHVQNTFLFWIDHQKKLYRMSLKSNLLKQLATSVQKIVSNKKHLYILCRDTKLYRIKLSAKKIKEPILEGVRDVTCNNKFAIITILE